MRIVAIADTHMFHEDLVIPEGAEATAWLRSLPHRHKILVAGNHDWCFMRQHEECMEILGDAVIYLRDEAVDLDGVAFWGSPWQPTFHHWAFNLDRGPPLAERWALSPESTAVLVTHGPPAGFGDRVWNGERVEGARAPSVIDFDSSAGEVVLVDVPGSTT